MLHRQDLATVSAQLHRKRLWSSSSFLVFMCRESHVVSVAWSRIYFPRERERNLPVGYLSIDRRKKWILLRAFLASSVGCSFWEEKLCCEVS